MNQIPGAQTENIWPALNALSKERNLIGHGVWIWVDDERPAVIWHSKFLESDDWIGAEYFDWDRFDYFMKRATTLLNGFAKFKQLVVEAVDMQKRGSGA